MTVLMVQWVSRLHGFDPSSVRVVDKVALVQACYRVLWFFPVRIIPQTLRTYFQLNVALI
jgi:hypothetical protein